MCTSISVLIVTIETAVISRTYPEGSVDDINNVWDVVRDCPEAMATLEIEFLWCKWELSVKGGVGS